MADKYALGDAEYTVQRHGLTLKCRRIMALVDIGSDVKAGDEGGFVQSEANLSQTGHCWLFDDSAAVEDANVSGNAVLRDRSMACGRSRVSNTANMGGSAYISGSGVLRNAARATCMSMIGGSAVVEDQATLTGTVVVTGNVVVGGSAMIAGSVIVTDKCRIGGIVRITGHGTFQGESVVMLRSDYLMIGPLGSRDAFTVFTKDQVSTGCFCGSFSDFEKAVTLKHGTNVHAQEYMEALAMARLRFPLPLVQSPNGEGCQG